MKLTDKLIGYLSRVFDRGPQAILALRIRYDGGMRWTIANGILTTEVTGGTGTGFSLDLRQFTVATLAANIALRPGYTVPFVDTTQIPGLLATVLLDGSGDQSASNGDHLRAYTSTLWAYMDAKASELQPLGDAVSEALLQMSANTASGDWVDEHGSFYAVGRRDGESDASYAARIVAEVGRARGNNLAIGAAVRVAAGADRVDVEDYAVETLAGDGTKSFGLFDVSVYLDVNAPLGFDGADASTRAVIEAMRNAGTHLRKLRYIRRMRLSTFVAAHLNYGLHVVVSPFAVAAPPPPPPPPPVAPTVYFGQDAVSATPNRGAWDDSYTYEYGVGDPEFYPYGPVSTLNATPARNSFVSDLGNYGICTFQNNTPDIDYPSNGLSTSPINITFSRGLPVTATITTTVGHVVTFSVSDGGGGLTGRFNTSPSVNAFTAPNFLEFNNNVTITFSSPVEAVGMYGSDWGDFDGKVLITLNFSDGTNYEIDTPLLAELNSSGSNSSGNLLFVGFISSNPISSVYIRSTTLDGLDLTDYFGIDDIIVGYLPPKIPIGAGQG